MTWRAPFPRARATWVILIGHGLSMSAAATALRWAIASFLGFGLPFVSYFPFLLAAAIWGGARGGGRQGRLSVNVVLTERIASQRLSTVC